jgi:hypothetical protein
MALKVKISQRADDVVGKGTIDGIVPFYYKDQGHRWMVRIGEQWTFKQRDILTDTLPSIPTARSKMYWAIAEFRTYARNLEAAESSLQH